MKDYLKEKTRFVMKTETLMGDGIAGELPDVLAAWEWSRVGLVVDGGLHRHNDYARQVAETLRQRLEHVTILIADMPEPTYDYLDQTRGVFADLERPVTAACAVATGPAGFEIAVADVAAG